MKNPIPRRKSQEEILSLKSKGEMNATEFKVARLSSKLAKMLKEYRDLTECRGYPTESIEACFLEMKIQRDTKKLAELISRSGKI